MTKRAIRVWSARDGFTLMELLAALAIGAVVLIAIAGLIRNVGLPFEIGTRSVANAERVMLAVERLSADFASARFVLSPGQGTRTVLFDGRPDRVIFVGAAPVVTGGRDEEVVFLAVENDGDVTRLVRRRAAWPGARTALEDAIPADQVVLLEGPLSIRFSFAGPPEGGLIQWMERWAGAPKLPRYVRLALRDRATGSDLLSRTDFLIRSDAPPVCSRFDATVACVNPVGPSPAASSSLLPRRPGR